MKGIFLMQREEGKGIQSLPFVMSLMKRKLGHTWPDSSPAGSRVVQVHVVYRFGCPAAS